jgi:hypothetical protein
VRALAAAHGGQEPDLGAVGHRRPETAGEADALGTDEDVDVGAQLALLREDYGYTAIT